MATPTAPGEGLQPLFDELREITRRLETLERPDGSQKGSLVAQVQAALANITATVAAAISANSYTKTQIDTLVANPPSVTTAGAVTITGSNTFTSSYARNNSVTTSYVAAYINSDGKFLATASSRKFKRDIVTYSGGDWRKIRAVTFRLRSAWILDGLAGGDGSKVPREVGVIAEELDALGYTELVVYDRDGSPWSVHYERIGVVALAASQELDKIVAAQAADIAALKKALGL